MPSKSKPDDSKQPSSNSKDPQDHSDRAEGATQRVDAKSVDRAKEKSSAAELLRLTKYIERLQNGHSRVNPWEEDGSARDPYTGEALVNQPFAAQVGRHFEPFSGAGLALQRQPAADRATGAASSTRDAIWPTRAAEVSPLNHRDSPPENRLFGRQTGTPPDRGMLAQQASASSHAEIGVSGSNNTSSPQEHVLQPDRGVRTTTTEQDKAMGDFYAQRWKQEHEQGLAAERAKALQRGATAAEPAPPTSPPPAAPDTPSSGTAPSRSASTMPHGAVPTNLLASSEERFFHLFRNVETGYATLDRVINTRLNPYLNLINPFTGPLNTLLLMDEALRRAAPDIHAGLISLPFIGPEVGILESAPAAFEYSIAALSESRALRSIVQAPVFWFMGAGGIGSGIPSTALQAPKIAKGEVAPLTALANDVAPFRLPQPNPGEEVYIHTFLNNTVQKATNEAAAFMTANPAKAAEHLPPGIGYINPFQMGGYVAEYTTKARLASNPISKSLFQGFNLTEQMRPGWNPDIALTPKFQAMWKANPWDVTTVRQAAIKAHEGVPWTFATYTIDWAALFRNAFGK